MAKIYCQTCGALNLYSMQKPNFCQKCGKRFDVGPASASSLENINEPKTENIPQLDGLEIEIALSSPMRGVELSKLAGTRDPKLKIEKSRGRPQDAQNEDVLEEFRKEASSLRRKT